MNENCFLFMTPCSGVSMNGLIDDPDSISLSIGDALMHRRSEGVLFVFLKSRKSLKIQLGSGAASCHASQT